MSIGTGSDFKIYDEQFFGGMTEVLMQNAAVFNEASGNTMQLVPQAVKGNFERESFFSEIAGLVSRRDVTSVAAVTDIKMAQGEHVDVKIDRKIGPVAQTLDAFRKIAVDPQEMSFILGQQFGKATTVDYLNTAIKSLVAALSSQTSQLFDYTATGTLTHTALASGLAKMGDNAKSILCFVMHSKVYYDLVKQSIADKIINVADMAIATGMAITLGRPVIITDAPDLKVAGSPDNYYTLGLVAGGGVIKESEEKNVVSFLVTGLENLVMRIQGEYAFNLSLKGFAWDSTNGGVNPSSATLATGANWLKSATDARNLAGVAIKTL